MPFIFSCSWLCFPDCLFRFNFHLLIFSNSLKGYHLEAVEIVQEIMHLLCKRQTLFQSIAPHAYGPLALPKVIPEYKARGKLRTSGCGPKQKANKNKDTDQITMCLELLFVFISLKFCFHFCKWDSTFDWFSFILLKLKAHCSINKVKSSFLELYNRHCHFKGSAALSMLGVVT